MHPGDILLIENKETHRGTWKKGRILKLLVGKDGVTRGVAMETVVNGHKRRLERAVQQIYPLEIRGNQNTEKRQEDKPMLRRSKRVAAADARAIISTIADEVNQDQVD